MNLCTALKRASKKCVGVYQPNAPYGRGLANFPNGKMNTILGVDLERKIQIGKSWNPTLADFISEDWELTEVTLEEISKWPSGLY